MGHMNLIYQLLAIFIIFKLQMRYHGLKCESLTSSRLRRKDTLSQKRQKKQPDVDILILGAGYASLGKIC